MAHWMDAVFKPRSVALLGASNQPGKMGYVFVQNLLTGYDGAIYPIHPTEDEILGIRAFRSVGEAPRPIDLAVVMTPPGTVPGLVEECGRAGVRAAVVITSGFAEIGAEGRKLQEETVTRARRFGLRLIGPNCFGIQNYHNKLNISMGLGLSSRPGGISLATQSGAYGMTILSFATEQRMGFAKIVSSGNKADVQDYEFLEYFGEDPETSVICFFLESLQDGRKFYEAARRVTTRKPVVVTKTARTTSGKRAAQSHTASLAGDHVMSVTAFRQAGMIWAESGLEMVDIAKAVDWQPVPAGNRVGIVTNTGGMGVELADFCESFGLVVPELSESDQKRIAEVLPPNASARNPVDVTPLWARFVEMYRRTMATFFESPDIDIIMPILLQRAAMNREVVEAVRDVVLEYRGQGVEKPTFVCWVSPEEHRSNQAILQEARIPVYEWPERTARVAAAVAKWGRWRQGVSGSGGASPISRKDPGRRRLKVEELIHSMKRQGRTWMTEEASRSLVALYDVPLVEGRVAKTAEEAVEWSERMGYPVVAKVVSPDIVHKSDVGGVRVRLQNPAEVREAFGEIIAAVTRKVPEARIDGIFVQKMVEGTELVVGAVRDPGFGPTVMFGLGGIFVEAIRDVVFRLAPVSESEAGEMIREIRGAPLLEGLRGRKPVAVDRLAELIHRVSLLIHEVPEIAELDLNPVIAGDGWVMGADARIRLERSERTEGSGS